MFVHNILQLADLKTVDQKGSRFYVVDEDVKYPSVTTVLGWAKKDHIQEWRNKVGAVEAARITSLAARRGTSVHKLVEQLVRNEEINQRKVNPVSAQLFTPLREYLEAHLTEVWAVEAAVFSHKLRVAGRTDIVGLIDGVPNIIDIKTSTKRKRAEWITDYFLQCSAYAYCIAEMTKRNINNYCICIVNEEYGTLDVHQGKCSDHVKTFYNLRNQFDI